MQIQQALAHTATIDPQVAPAPRPRPHSIAAAPNTRHGTTAISKTQSAKYRPLPKALLSDLAMRSLNMAHPAVIHPRGLRRVVMQELDGLDRQHDCPSPRTRDSGRRSLGGHTRTTRSGFADGGSFAGGRGPRQSWGVSRWRWRAASR